MGDSTLLPVTQVRNMILKKLLMSIGSYFITFVGIQIKHPTLWYYLKEKRSINRYTMA